MSHGLRKEITLEISSGSRVAADLSLPIDARLKGVVVFLHGYKGFKDWGCWNVMTDRFAAAQLAVVKFNFSHNGTTIESPLDFVDLESFAENTYSREVDEARSVIDIIQRGELNQFGLPGGLPIYLLGHSRGGGISILAAASNVNVTKVATWASVSDFGRRFPTGDALQTWKANGVMHVANARTGQQLPHNYSWFSDYLNNAARLDIRAAARKLQQPLQIIHAADDEAVHVSESRELFNAASHASLIVMHHGGHTFGARHPWEGATLPDALREAVDQTLAFFAE